MFSIFTKKTKLALIIKALTAAGVRPTAHDLALIIEDPKAIDQLFESAKLYYWKTL